MAASRSLHALFSVKPKVNSPETDLFAEVEVKSFQEKSIHYIKQNYLYNDADLILWQLFCENINFLPEEKEINLNQYEKLILLKTAFQCLKNPLDSGELAQFSRMAEDIKYEFGTMMFQDIFETDITQNKYCLSDYITVSQLLIELKDLPHIYQIFDNSLGKLQELKQKLNDERIRYINQLYPERSIEETIQRFRQVDENLNFPLPVEELNIIKEEYIRVKLLRESLQFISLTQIREQAAEAAKLWVDNRDISSKYKLIALILETIRRKLGILPYDTQVLAVLALLNYPESLRGRIAQIKTGEGKSTINVILATFEALQGHFVDVVTSSAYLAKRDAEKYRSFFNILGLTVSAIDDQSTQEDFKGQVIFGSNTAFEFAWLREGLYQRQIRLSIRNANLQPRTFDIVINDEVDNLFLDKGSNSAIISIPNPDKENTFIYKLILEFVTKYQLQNKLITEEMVTPLRLYLLQHSAQINHANINEWSHFRYKQWLNSAKEAEYVKKEEEDYLIIDGKIVIIDRDTGCKSLGTQWQHGLHQFIQCKHNSIVTPQSMSAASVSHPTYFSLYKKLYGVTGTMGEDVERKEIQQIYQVDCFDVPPHLTCLRKKQATLIAKNNEEHHQLILKIIQEKQQAGRPILPLFSSIKTSKLFADLMKSQGIKHQILNDNQPESIDFLVARAGEAGMVTDATNIAGRGTDILLSRESRVAGGLCVIITFYPDNLRIYMQNIGRSGRQGAPGDYCMILNLEDEEIQKLTGMLAKMNIYLDPEKMSADEIVNLLDMTRTMLIQRESAQRIKCAEREKIYFEKLQLFFNEMKLLTDAFNSPECKQNIINQCKNYQPDDSHVEEIITDEKLKPLIHGAIVLLKYQSQELPVDWSGFFDQFKQYFLAAAKLEWAKFYSKLHDDIESENLEEVKQEVNHFYKQALPKLNQFLVNPEKKITKCLQSILYRALEKMIAEFEETPRLSMRK